MEWINPEDAHIRELFDGICVHTLWKGEGGSAQLLEIELGACWKGVNVHKRGSEEAFDVTGIFNDRTRDYPAGLFSHNPVGSSHVP